MGSTRTSPQVVIEDVQEDLATLERRIDRLSAEALTRVRADAAIAERFDALDSITGVGTTSQFSNARIVARTRSSSDPSEVKIVNRRATAP